MAKSFTVAVLVATALCFSSLLISASAHDRLYVEGKVYCDTCRVEFLTKLSEALEGAKVRLECRSELNGTVSFSTEGVTDVSGTYNLAVEGDHEEEICEVKVINSPKIECSEPFKSANAARVVLTKNVGVVEPKRFANPLGFMAKTALSGCGPVLQELGFLPLEVEQ